MNRQVEDFSAELTVPEVFREICALILAVNKTCVLRATTPHEEDEEPELVLYAASTQAAMLVWVHLSANMMFSEFNLTRSDYIEIHSDTMAHAFRSDSGLLSMNDIKIKISRRGAPSSGSNNGSTNATPMGSNQSYIGPSMHAIPPKASAARLISVKMYNKSIEGLITKAVEQRVYGEAIDPSQALVEPVHDEIGLWADLQTEQLDQMAKVTDQYKQMDPRVTLSINPLGEFKLSVRAQSVSAVSKWQIEFAQRVDASQANTEQQEEDEIVCTVLAKDWHTIMHARRLYRRVVVGIIHGQVTVVYGFLRQGESQLSDSVNYYLTHRNL